MERYSSFHFPYMSSTSPVSKVLRRVGNWGPSQTEHGTQVYLYTEEPKGTFNFSFSMTLGSPFEWIPSTAPPSIKVEIPVL